MNSNKWKVLIGLLIAGLIFAGFGYYLFQKKVQPLDNAKADFSLTADALFDAFEADENTATAKYVDKIIEVTGEVERLIIGTEGSSVVVLKAENAITGGINCSFGDMAVRAEAGQTITVKGRCQGFLLNVVLNNCALVPETE